MGRKNKAEQHFNHYCQHQDRQEYLQLVLFESSAQTRADLGSESGSNQQEQRQNEIDGSV